MKQSKRVLVMASLTALLAICGCRPQSTQTNHGSIPTTLDLPADFTVRPSDWVDDDRPNVGWPLGESALRGKAIQERNGVFPIHVMRADLPQLEDAPLMVDDLLVGVDGMPLGRDPEDQFAYAVKRARRNGRSLSVTRWRKGRISTVEIDFSVFDRGHAIPDLTQGGTPDETRDWALGPLGVNGWGFSLPANQGGSDKARQLLITLVDKEGPSAETLNVGDVIVGVDGERFSRDARKALAAAINEAEKEENQGELKLTVWRPLDSVQGGDGEELEVVITLPVLGGYSETAPFDCPKTERIIDNAVAYMKQNQAVLLKPEGRQGWINYINGLGLLATGREDVMPMVRELAHASLLEEGEFLSVEKHVPMQCWWWSYRTLFLCEYYLRTGDEAVLPTIKEYATKIAMGQSGAGTWGHTYAARENTGYLHGHLGGYGAINQMGLTMMIVLPLAEKCGVRNNEVRDAIRRGDEFFSYFIGKGTIPYGDHGAAPWFDDNGKSGSAALYFDLVGNRKGTQFFSEMILASAPSGREAGHTGHFWSHLWGGLGAARGGDKGLQVFMDVMNPVFTLERQHDGRFAFQDNVGERGERGKPKNQWDSTGARLLQLCVPKRALYITGRETPRETHLTQQRIDQILKAGRLDVDREAWDDLTVPEILELLEDPLSPTRALGARIIEAREINLVDTLIGMLDSPNRYARYGAAEALGRAGFAGKEAADTLIRMMETDDDTQFRVYAIAAMTNTDPTLGLFSVAKPAIPVLLKMAVQQAEDDPRKVLQHDIARALFFSERGQPTRGLLPRYGLEGVDRSLLIPAIREILTNQNGWARSTMSHFIYPLLSESELEPLWGDIYRATRHIAPSGIMFASEVRTDGLRLMADHRVKEGLDLAAWYVRYQKGHGNRRRVPSALDAILKYEAYAKRVIPELESHAKWYEGPPENGTVKPNETAQAIREAIAKINAFDEPPDFELISIAEHLEQPGTPRK